MDKPINPVKSLVSDNGSDWVERYVVANTGVYVIAVSANNAEQYLAGQPYDHICWKVCKPLLTKRSMTRAEIFKALSNGAVLRERFGGSIFISNCFRFKEDTRFGTEFNCWTICYNYTGTDDKWESLETEE